MSVPLSARSLCGKTNRLAESVTIVPINSPSRSIPTSVKNVHVLGLNHVVSEGEVYLLHHRRRFEWVSHSEKDFSSQIPNN